MNVRCVENLEELAPLRETWDALAGDNVFRSWTWLSAWWRHYGQNSPRRRLAVLLAFREPTASASLAAALPCYVDSSWRRGRVLRLIGDGEVCSDHAGLVASEGNPVAAADAIAAHLAERDDWDLVDFAGIDADDAEIGALAAALARYDCTVSRLVADRCWAIELPPTWDEFLALQSKSHRKQLRQLERRVLQSDRARWRLVNHSAQFADAWSVLVDLHQRRRQSLGEPGCFASPAWAALHWEVAQQLLAEGRLRLSTLELDGLPTAAEYHFVAGDRAFAYQGGVDPTLLHEEPGQLSLLCTIQHAISEGRRHFDLLRGDEPYKAHWRATPRQAVRLVAVPPRTWPRLRQGAWQGARRVAAAARQVRGLFS